MKSPFGEKVSISGNAPTTYWLRKRPLWSNNTTLPGSVLGLDSTATATRLLRAATLFGPAPYCDRSIRLIRVGFAGFLMSTISRLLLTLLVTNIRIRLKATVSAEPAPSPVAYVPIGAKAI